MKRIIALAWGKDIIVEENGKKDKMRNWYATDFLHGKEAGLRFTWGYFGGGPHATAYSILREFYGKKTALEYYAAFVSAYIAKLPETQGFEITREQMDDLMPGIVLQK